MHTTYTTEGRAGCAAATTQIPPTRRRRAIQLYPAKLAALVLAWMFAVLWPGLAGAQSYTATPIGPDPAFPGPSLSKMNDLGEIVGQYYPDWTNAWPVVWRNGAFAALPLLPGTIGGVARANNNTGQIVGSCFAEDGTYHACIWQNGAVTALPTLPDAIQTEAIDINDAGGITGSALVPFTYSDGSAGSRQYAVVWQGGTVQAILPPVPDLESMYAQAIDASGRVAVSVYDEWSGITLPGRWTPDVPNGSTGTVEVLDLAGGASSDINDSGVVCGYDASQLATFWNGVTPTVIGTLPGDTWAFATGINATGTVVGYSTFYSWDGFDPTYTAFIWSADRGMRNLNILLNNSSSVPGPLTFAIGISDAGQILAMSNDAYFLLTPSPLPPPLPAPTGLFNVAGDKVVHLGWSPVAVATGYNVKRSITSGGPYVTIATGVSDTNYSDKTVVNGTRYYYIVTAVDGARESANSNETNAKPLATPLAPTGLTAKVSHAKVTLTWRQSTSPEVRVNRIYRSTNGGAYALIASIPAGLTWTDNSVSSKTPYRYVVTAVNAIGLESPASNAVSAQPK